MNKEAILNFLKKNALSLVCGLVAILAIVAVYYPLGGMVTQLQSDADAAAQAFSELSTLYNKPRSLPMSDPNATDPGKLTIFPNPSVITAGNDANTKWTNFSLDMMTTLQKLNQNGHELLAGTDELPLPGSDSTYFAFKKLYSLVLSTDPTVSGVGYPDAAPPIPVDQNLQSAHRLNLQNDVLNGGLPPTPEQITQTGNDLWKNKYEPQLQTRNGQPINQLELQDEWNKEYATLPLRMKADAAKKHKVYVEKDAFTLNTAIVSVDKPQVTDIWYAQMQLWIQQDLAAAIAEENAGTSDILNCPVKRLLSMQIPSAPMYVLPPASAAGQASPTGGPATVDEKSPIPPIYTLSVTGRYSNAMYDVIPFRIVIDVDAKKVNEVIEKFSNQRLMTITNQNLFALDAEAESARGYLYGPDATVRLQLEGEALFLRSWTKDLMPEKIKAAMGLGPPGTPLTPMPTGGQPGFMGGPPGMGGFPPHP